jgi:Tol biopolymer transport system component
VYEITAQIGEGGMGQVYRARDTRLNRDVALKVLPDSVASDPDRLARFTREAQTLASLNHPNIAHIHGIEESGGVRALVMELVEGDDLSQRIARGAIPLDEALPIARQIAEALEAAHEQGIIHRDLKPANIKVREDGTVKVLDFGLAKAMDVGSGGSGRPGGLSMSPTITTPAMTQAGMILGTAAYMSPEQARGKTVDKRADIWAFGAVLYEMLTGTRAFEGEDIADTLGNVMKVEPSWDRCPASIPPRVVQVMRGCLQKNPKQRIDSAQDVRLALEGAFETAAPQTSVPASSSAPHGRLAWLVAAGAVVGMVALVAPAVRHLRETAPVQQSYRFQIAPPPGNSFTTFRLSPDGRYVAYLAARAVGGTGAGALWIRALESLESREIPGSEGSTYPFWSPDSAGVGFFQAGKLKKVAVAGGPIQTICDVVDARGGAWGPDGTILFADGPGAPISRVSSSGGKPAPVTKLTSGDPSAGHRAPEFLPDGQHFLFDGTSNNPDNAGILLGALDGSAATRLLQDDSSSVFAQGHLFFLRDGTLMALPFDPARHTATAEAFPVAENVAIAANNRYGAFSLAGNGTLAYWSSGAVNTRELVWMDRSGKRVSSLGEPRAFGPFALSADEKTVAATIGGFPQTDLWLLDSASGLSNKFTFGSNASFPVWSADSKTIVYARRSGNGATYDVVRKPIMGGAEEVLLAQTINAFPSDVSLDGKSIALSLTVAKMASDIGLLAADGDHRASVYLSSAASEVRARFSPDGKWMAYNSDESGQIQVYVQTIPVGGGKFLISTSGGNYPAWRRDGRELYYLDPGGKLMAVPVNINGVPGAPQALLSAPGATFFAVTHDGQRFLMNVPAGGESAAAGPPLTVVTNWRAGLKK